MTTTPSPSRQEERQIEGVILKCTPYGEADAIVSLLTPQLGRITLFAKGGRSCRRPRFGVCLQPFLLVRAGFRERRAGSMASLCRLDPLRINAGISRDLATLAVASWCVDFCLQTAPEQGEAVQLHRVLVDFLQRLDGFMEPPGWSELVGFQLAALDSLGFRQELWCCPLCCQEVEHADGAADGGKAEGGGGGGMGCGCTTGDGLDYSAADGGLVCHVCATDRRGGRWIPVDGATLVRLRELADWGAAGFPFRLNCSALAPRQVQQLREISRAMVEEVVGKRLRSTPFLEEALGDGVSLP